MTKRQFVVLVFRLFALYLLFNFITNLGYLIGFVSQSNDFELYLTPAFTIFATLALISFLWRRSEWLMEKIFAIPALSDKTIIVEPLPSSTDDVEKISEDSPKSFEIMDYYETPISKESLEIIAFSLIGAWAIFNYLPRFLSWVEFIIELIRGNPIVTSLFSLERLASDLFASVIQFSLGIWLFLRPWQFQEWIEKFKPQHDKDENMVKSN
jgi:hypothetical protein